MGERSMNPLGARGARPAARGGKPAAQVGMRVRSGAQYEIAGREAHWMAEAAPGVFISSLNCKTGDTENLVVTWAVDAGVTSGGYRWRLGTPPGTDPTLDFQLIKLEPFTVCTTSAAPAGGARLGLNSAGPPRPDQD